jgi:hypothetical protein
MMDTDQIIAVLRKVPFVVKKKEFIFFASLNLVCLFVFWSVQMKLFMRPPSHTYTSIIQIKRFYWAAAWSIAWLFFSTLITFSSMVFLNNTKYPEDGPKKLTYRNWIISWICFSVISLVTFYIKQAHPKYTFIPAQLYLCLYILFQIVRTAFLRLFLKL